MSGILRYLRSAVAQPGVVRRLALLLAATLLFGSLSACEAPVKLYQMEYSGYFDTVSQFTMPAQSEAAFMDQANYFEERLAYYHDLYTGFEAVDDVKNVWLLNQEAGENPVEVSRDLMDMLVYAQGLMDETNGAFSITLGTVTTLWREEQVPEQDVLDEALEHTDPEDLVLNPERLTVYFTDPELQLDVGAVAKGFAAERIASELQARQVDSALVNLGGNVRTIGQKVLATTTPWMIGIQNPIRRLDTALRNYQDVAETDESEALTRPHLTYPTGETTAIAELPQDTETPADTEQPSPSDTSETVNGPNLDQDYLAILDSADSSLVTSGIYERFFIENGNLYHHIVDPQTGMPSQRFQSVSVITRHSGLADGMATALFNMSLEEGMALVNSREHMEAVWIDMSGEMNQSYGFEALVHTEVSTTTEP